MLVIVNGHTSQKEFVDNVMICELLGCSDHNQILDRLDMRNFSFSQRSVNEWNKLSADCVGASLLCNLYHVYIMVQ